MLSSFPFLPFPSVINQNNYGSTSTYSKYHFVYIILVAELLLTNTKTPPTVHESPWFRYLAVVFPVSSKVLRTKFNTQVAISVSWAVSLLLSFPALFLHGLVESKAEDNQVGAGLA